MSLVVQAVPPRPQVVRPADRVLDVTSAVLVSAGVGLFLYARRALNALASGTYSVPDGVSWVSRAEMHDLQSRVGLWVTAVGGVMALLAFGRHAWRRPPGSPGAG